LTSIVLLYRFSRIRSRLHKAAEALDKRAKQLIDDSTRSIQTDVLHDTWTHEHINEEQLRVGNQLRDYVNEWRDHDGLEVSVACDWRCCCSSWRRGTSVPLDTRFGCFELLHYHDDDSNHYLAICDSTTIEC
jgi:hypothetical protein